MTILAFIFGVVITFFALGIVTHCKDTQPKNNVHFYVAREGNGNLSLWLGKPNRKEVPIKYWEGNINVILFSTNNSSFRFLGLNIEDYKDLKWEDEPVEVFLNLNN